MNKVRIVGAIASPGGVTIYFDNGKDKYLPNDKIASKALLDDVLRDLAKYKSVEIDLDDYSVERRIEKRTNGLVRFLKKTVTKIGDFFHIDHPANTPVDATREEILVASVAGKEIPIADTLNSQMEEAAWGESAAGFQLFMERIASVIDERGHSVQELLNFIKDGDLPIAEDGSIIAYKMLYRQGKNGFVDPHTRKVYQEIGSRVSMPVDAVDPSRRVLCSVGLHVARRQYLSGFNGDTIALIKIAPEDVVAVPFNEPSKMRVAAYHLVAKVNETAYALLRNGKPMTSDPESAKLLADVIAGNHVGVLKEVRIHGENGTAIKTKKIAEPPAEIKPTGKTARALDDPSGQSSITLKEIQKVVAEVEDEVLAAAASGNLAAAISEPAPAKPKKAKKPKTKPADVPAAAPSRSETDLPELHQKALKLHDEGKSQRQIETELHVCRKTIRKLVKNYRSSDNTTT